MKYTLGAYIFNPNKPFKTLNEAISFIQERHPEVSEEAIEKRLKPKIQENDSDRSGRVDEKIQQSGEDVAKASKGGPKSNRTTTS